MERPNIVVIVVEQWRGDLTGYAGNPVVKTPCVDSLAESGMAFSNAFTTNPICTPSRCALMTGLHTHTSGHRTQRHLVGRNEPNLLASLKGGGYTTAMLGKNDVLHPDVFKESLDLAGPDRGSDQRPTSPRRSNPFEPDDPRFYTFLWGAEQAPANEHPDAVTNSRALAFIDGTPSDTPFCAWINYGLAHPPYRVQEPWWSMYDQTDVGELAPPTEGPDPDRPFLRLLHQAHKLDRLSPDVLVEIRRRYMAMISRADSLVGELVSGLKERGIWDQTALFVLSDHGNYAGDYGVPAKWWTGMEDALLRVPLVARIPGQRNRGVSSELVQHIDINQTIHDLAGAKRAHPTSSRSLMPLLMDNAPGGPHREVVLASAGHWLGQEHPLDLDRSLFRTLEDRDHLYYPWKRVIEDHPEASCRTYCIRDTRWKYVWRMNGSEEIYDTREDPLETSNLLGKASERLHDPDVVSIHTRLKDRLLREVLSSVDAPEPVYPDVPGSLSFPSIDSRGN